MQIRRHSELKKLDEIWKKSLKKGRILVLVGPDGSGKTHLVKDFARNVKANILYYRSEPGEEHMPLVTIRRFASIYFPEVIRGRISANSLFERIFEAIKESAPVIVYFRDVNYSDPLSIKFFQHFSLDSQPGVLLVLSYPMGEEKKLDYELEKIILGENADILEVDNLNKEQTEEYLREYGMEKYAREFYKISKGNISSLELLVECHKIGKSVKSVSAGLRCIYRSLSKEEKRIVKAGAVIGNMFPEDLIGDVLGKLNKKAIESLIEKDIIREFLETYRSGIYRGYVFMRRDFKGFVYENINDEERKELHEKVAQAIEKRKVYPEWERIFSLTHHYSMSENMKKTIKYTKRCIEISQETRDYDSSLYYLLLLEKFLNRENDDFTRSWLYYSVMHAAENAGKPEISTEYGDKLNVFANIEKARTYNTVGEYKKAISICNRALKCKDEYLKMIAYEIMADSQRKLGFYREALKTQKKHIEHAERIKNELEIAIGYKNLGNILLSMMNYEEAEQYYWKAMKIFRKLKNTMGIASVYNNLGIIYNDWGKSKKALEYYKKSISLYEKIRNYDGIATAYNNLGTAYENLGDFNNAIEAYRRSIDYNTILGDIDGLNYGYSNMANILTEYGDFRSAWNYAQRELKIAEKIGSIKFRISANITLATICYFTGRYEEGIKYAKKAIRIGSKRKNYFDSADAYYYIAKIHYAQGKEEECVKWAEKALEYYKKMGIEDRASHIYSLLTRCKGEKTMEEMERVVKIYFPDDEYYIWMAKIITLAKKEEEHWAYFDRLIEGLKSVNNLATLVDFLEEYYRITGYEDIKKEAKKIKENSTYP